MNPCEEKGACGLNAECKVAFRKAQCACPPGYFGNPFVDCKPGKNKRNKSAKHMKKITKRKAHWLVDSVVKPFEKIDFCPF